MPSRLRRRTEPRSGHSMLRNPPSCARPLWPTVSTEEHNAIVPLQTPTSSALLGREPFPAFLRQTRSSNKALHVVNSLVAWLPPHFLTCWYFLRLFRPSADDPSCLLIAMFDLSPLCARPVLPNCSDAFMTVRQGAQANKGQPVRCSVMVSQVLRDDCAVTLQCNH